MIPLACQCGRSLKADESLVGRQVRCPACESIVPVPGTPLADTDSIASFDLRTHDSLDGSNRSVLAGSAIRPEQKFSHYLIKRRLGAGAMGEVWLAFDTALERELAIKILPPSLAEDQERLLRFFREARLAAQLNHPNVVTIYQVSVEEGLPFLAMELVDGGSLEDLVRRDGPLDWPEATRVIRDAAAGLAEAHALELVHRDIKPANLLKSSKGFTKVADFGLARAASQRSSLTSAGVPLGTPAYMPPEQWKGEAVDGRSDLYSLACSYYFLLTGKPPFDAPSAPALGYQHAHVEFPDARQHVPQLPSAVCRILERGAQKNPDQRYQSAADFVAELDALLAATAGGLSQFRPVPRPVAPQPAAVPQPKQEAALPGNRHKLLVAAGIAGVLLFGVIIYITSKGRTTKIELDDPNAVVKVESEDEMQPVAETAVDNQSTDLLADTAVNQPTFDDAARAPQLPVWAETVVTTDPMPDATLIEQTEVKIREDFKQRLSEGKLEDSAKLANELLTLAAAPVHQAAERFAYLRMARTLAVEARDVMMALQTCDQLAARFDVDPVRMKAAVIFKCANVVKAKAEHADAIATQSCVLGFEAIARDDYRYVGALCRLAKQAAGVSKNPYHSMQVDFMEEEAAVGQAAYEAVAPLAEKLRQDKDDPAANRAAGAFLCLVKGDWPRGLPMLVRGDEPKLAELAKQEQARPTGVDDQVALGDAWWLQAIPDGPSEPAHALGMRQRARYWYLKALSQVSATQQTPLARRLQPRIDAVPSRPVVLRIRMQHCDGPHVLRITNDGIKTTKNTYGTRVVQVNHLRWDRHVLNHVNCGAMRLYPGAIDFSTAHLVKEWHGRWGWISFKISPDCFELHQGHGPAGATDFEVVVTFQSQGFAVANRFEGLWETQFYKFKRQDWQAPDGIQTAAGWDKMLAAGAVDTRTLNHLNFRSEKEPYITPSRPPSDKVSYDYYALVAKSVWSLEAGEYEVVTMADDGIRVFIDDKMLINKWKLRGIETDRSTIRLSEGQHRLRVEYFQHDKHARLQFQMRRLGGG